LLWCRDATCSPVIEHFFTAQSTSSATKQILLASLRSNIKSLATDKFGSHVLDTIFAVSSLDTRTWICEELLLAAPSLTHSFHATFVLRNCALDLFKRRREEWNVYQRGLIKDRKAVSKSASSALKSSSSSKKNRKKQDDEIDDIFASKK
jgi:nucleolar protein 9